MRQLQLFWIFLALSSYPILIAHAQSSEQYIHTKCDSTKGYWILKASQYDKTPTVQFYSAQHQLMYQEILPSQFQRVGRKTKRAIDKLLINLVNRQILSSTYLNEQSIDLVDYLPINQLASEKSFQRIVFKKGTAILSVEPSLNSSGQLLIHCSQLANKWLAISLQDEEHNEFFERCFNESLYNCKIKLTMLPSGVYHLKVGRFNNPFKYCLLVDQATAHYQLLEEMK